MCQIQTLLEMHIRQYQSTGNTAACSSPLTTEKHGLGFIKSSWGSLDSWNYRFFYAYNSLAQTTSQPEFSERLTELLKAI